MENIQKKMKYLTKFGQKVHAVKFNSQPFFIVESGRFQNDGNEHRKDYSLFDEKGQEIGYLNLKEVLMSEEEIEWEKLDGVKIVPNDFFLLIEIEISKDSRCNGLGSMLLNWATKEMQKIANDKEKDIPLLFIRQNSTETFAFYKKWNAEVNQAHEDNKIGSSCYMIIEKPEPQTKYDVEIVAEYEKPSAKKEDRQR